MKYDYLIVGAGIYGAMFANRARANGKTCLVIDKNKFVGGFCHTERMNEIDVHCFGAHIFRTDRKDVWDFVNSICEFEPFINTPIAIYHDEVYNMPFNMNTFSKLFGVSSPLEAMKSICLDRVKIENPSNLEEYALSVVGCTIYEKLIKEYTEKQWGKKCSELPVSTMSRIPIRFTYDNNYYRERYQGVPKYGYTAFVQELLKDTDVVVGVDWKDFKESNQLSDFGKIVYTGPIDEFCEYRFGRLEWRSVRFEHKYFQDNDNVQGVAVMNYTDSRPYTRSIEHKHFLHTECKGSVVSYEYPCQTSEIDMPSYPILNERNKVLYEQYKGYADINFPNVIFGGRLGRYKYYSMNEIIEEFI